MVDIFICWNDFYLLCCICFYVILCYFYSLLDHSLSLSLTIISFWDLKVSPNRKIWDWKIKCQICSHFMFANLLSYYQLYLRSLQSVNLFLVGQCWRIKAFLHTQYFDHILHHLIEHLLLMCQFNILNTQFLLLWWNFITNLCTKLQYA